MGEGDDENLPGRLDQSNPIAWLSGEVVVPCPMRVSVLAVEASSWGSLMTLFPDFLSRLRLLGGEVSLVDSETLALPQALFLEKVTLSLGAIIVARLMRRRLIGGNEQEADARS